MTQAVISLGEHEDNILNIVKGKYGLKNKSDAVNFVIKKFEEEILEPHLKPDFVQRIKVKEKSAVYESYSSFDKLKKDIENA